MRMASTSIYYFPIDATGKETGEAIPVTLDANGVADISKLPPDIQDVALTSAQDITHTMALGPKDGARFLNALLRMTNGYIRFRSEPTKTA